MRTATRTSRDWILGRGMAAHGSSMLSTVFASGLIWVLRDHQKLFRLAGADRLLVRPRRMRGERPGASATRERRPFPRRGQPGPGGVREPGPARRGTPRARASLVRELDPPLPGSASGTAGRRDRARDAPRTIPVDEARRAPPAVPTRRGAPGSRVAAGALRARLTNRHPRPDDSATVHMCPRGRRPDRCRRAAGRARTRAASSPLSATSGPGPTPLVARGATPPGRHLGNRRHEKHTGVPPEGLVPVNRAGLNLDPPHTRRDSALRAP